MMILMVKFGKDSMDERSAIQEYYLTTNGLRRANGNGNVSNKDIHELLTLVRNEQFYHLSEQDKLLSIIRNQSKPQFYREVGANLVGSAIWDGLLYLGSKFIKL